MHKSCAACNFFIRCNFAFAARLDIFGAAETGSGKTLAFGIPIVNRLLDDKKRNKMGALILTPTRELAVQIKKHLTDITEVGWNDCKYYIRLLCLFTLLLIHQRAVPSILSFHQIRDADLLNCDVSQK